MAKSARVKSVLRSLAVMIFFSAILVASACDFFAPPFVFDNPYDPQQEFRMLGSIGHRIYSEGGGLAYPNRIAVVHGEFLVTPSAEQSRITRYSFSNVSYDTVTVVDSDGYEPWIRDVCIVDGGQAIYAAGWRGVHRIDPATRTVTHYGPRYAEHEFIRLAPDPDGGLWALGFWRLNNGDEIPRLVHISPAGNVVADRVFHEFANHYIGNWDIAVSNHRIAISRQHDVLYLDRSDLENPLDRLVYDNDGGSYYLPPTETTFHGNLDVRGIAYNPATNRFVAIGWWHSEDRSIGYLDGVTGAPLAFVGTNEEMPGYDWRGVAVSSGHEYVSNAQTGQVIRVDSWQSVHENGDDPLGFQSLRDINIDPFVEPALLYALDQNGAIHVIDSETQKFVRYFGPPDEQPGAIHDPASVFFTPDAMYIGQFGNVYRYTRTGEFTEAVSEDGPHIDRFVIHDGNLVVTFHSHHGRGLRVVDLATDESESHDDYFPSSDVKLGVFDGEVIAVYSSEEDREIVIGTIGLSPLSFTPTARVPDSVIRLEHHPYVSLSGLAVTSHGFLWLLNERGVALRTDRNGVVYRTVSFDPHRPYRGAAVDADGRVYFGAYDRIDVYGAR